MSTPLSRAKASAESAREQEQDDSRANHLAAAEGALLRVDDVVAGYVPGVNILNGADLYVQEGELVGIIGPNGAGKSTLLKAMFGLVKIRSGAVTLRGEEITNLKAHALVRKGVGFVPQTENVFPSLTIEENLQMGLYQAPKKFPERFEFVTSLFPALGERRDDPHPVGIAEGRQDLQQLVSCRGLDRAHRDPSLLGVRKI